MITSSFAIRFRQPPNPHFSLRRHQFHTVHCRGLFVADLVKTNVFVHAQRHQSVRTPKLQANKLPANGNDSYIDGFNGFWWLVPAAENAHGFVGAATFGTRFGEIKTFDPGDLLLTLTPSQHEH